MRMTIQTSRKVLSRVVAYNDRQITGSAKSFGRAPRTGWNSGTLYLMLAMFSESRKRPFSRKFLQELPQDPQHRARYVQIILATPLTTNCRLIACDSSDLLILVFERRVSLAHYQDKTRWQIHAGQTFSHRK